MTPYPILADDFRQAVKALAAAPASNLPAHVVAKGFGYSDRTIQMLEERAAVGAITSSGGAGDAMTSLSNGGKAWLATLRTESIFARLYTGSMLKVALNEGLAIATSAPTAKIIANGRPAPLTNYSASHTSLAPVTALALLALSDQVARGSDEGSLALLDAELRGAVAAAIDSQFWSLMGVGATGFSLGSSSGSFKTDVQALLASVNTSGTGQLIFVMSPDVANWASQFDLDMCPTGGEILGLPAIPSSVVPSGTMRLINASATAGNLQEITVDTSQSGSFEMKDGSLTQDATTGTGVTLVSAFQSDLTIVRAIATFGAARLRANAAHEITAITSSWTA